MSQVLNSIRLQGGKRTCLEFLYDFGVAVFTPRRCVQNVCKNVYFSLEISLLYRWRIMAFKNKMKSTVCVRLLTQTISIRKTVDINWT